MGVTIDGVDVSGWWNIPFGVAVWMDKFARAVPGGEMACGTAAAAGTIAATGTFVWSGGLGILNSKLVLLPTLPIVGLGLLLP